MVFSNFEQNVYFRSYKYWILRFLKFQEKKLILFQNLFSFVSSYFEKGMRKQLNSSDKKKKLLLILITTVKIFNFSVNGFYLLKEVQLTCFLPLSCLKNIFEPRKFIFQIDFRVLYGFLSSLISYQDVINRPSVY